MGLTNTVKHHPLIQPLLATLEVSFGMVIPAALRKQARKVLVEALRLSLIQLHERSAGKEALSKKSKPIADGFCGSTQLFIGKW